MDTLISILVRVLEVIFMLGLVGSAIVLILTSLEDIKSLLPGSDDKKEPALGAGAPHVRVHASDPIT